MSAREGQNGAANSLSAVHGETAERSAMSNPTRERSMSADAEQRSQGAGATADSPPFRFYDNRQKYLTFVNTCNEKAVIVKRAAMELAHVQPTPPALRLFDAGMGDATVLSRMMRTAHRSSRPSRCSRWPRRSA